MSFLRPEATKSLRRWSEPIAMIVVVAFALRWLWIGIHRDSIVLIFIGGFATVVSGAMLYVSVLRVRLHMPSGGLGLVDVREREITYYAPEGGGSIELDAMRRLELSNTTGHKNWILWGPDGALVIPVAAEGADDLIETFGALPGLGYDTLVRAMENSDKVISRIWEKVR
ncbi:MAG TPA: hypothetical protein VLA51_02775 [Paracoccaceae bacterium]|nr:hypothetical protein [Paracoccaceae bacterium]